MTENDEQLIPVFSPSLALLLAQAEEVKGKPLTEDEVISVRDNAVCMMVAPEAAAGMDESRGYCDVEPENCWADWHRLRVEVTGDGCLPKIILCLVGDEEFERRATFILQEANIEFEVQEHDERMVTAFAVSDYGVFSSLDDDDLQRIDEHTRVIYVLSRNFPSAQGPVASHVFLQIGRRLIEEAGAVAIKCESSGIAHSGQRWIDLCEKSGDEPADTPEFWESLFRTYVKFPISSETDLYSCGMHLLGYPDMIISRSILEKIATEDLPDENAAVMLFFVFSLYLMIECTIGGFKSGDTFRPNEDWQRLRVRWEECTTYEPDNFFYNPYGRWRFAELA
ncbi:MAG: hypothetical protein K2X93_10780 [Candidatus Obscuribacterales bacterium]|nr:hypothetical protein [Candidatus Obscuribacterales bacterium]